MEIMTIKVENGISKIEWKKVKPSSTNNPYSYNTAHEAERMLKICYPESYGKRRVVNAEDNVINTF
jgi:hypothetical protein